MYLLHAGVWLTFIAARAARRPPQPAGAAPAATEERTAPLSRALLAFHMVGMGVLYFGLGNTIIPGRVPERFPQQRLAGGVVMVLAAALAAWAMTSFRSWRFRARVEVGHELATGGPFAWVRHPIYLAMDLLALGTALWVPDPIVIAGLLLIILGGDLRARSEEKILLAAFGDAYRAYMGRAWRFLPGLY